MIREVSIELPYFWQRQPRYPNTQSNPLKKKKKKKKPFPKPSQHTTNFDYFIIKQKLATLMRAIQGLTQETARKNTQLDIIMDFIKKLHKSFKVKALPMRGDNIEAPKLYTKTEVTNATIPITTQHMIFQIH